MNRYHFLDDKQELPLEVALDKATNVGEAIDATMRKVEAEVDKELGETGGPYLRDVLAAHLYAERCLQLLARKFDIRTSPDEG